MSGFIVTLSRLVGIGLALYLAVGTGYRILESRLWRLEIPVIKGGAKDDQAKRGVAKAESAAILTRNIFGAAGSSSASTSRQVKEVIVQSAEAPKASSFKAVLLGTVAGGDGVSRAVIGEAEKKKQGLYKVGDSVEGALIKEIERGRVLLTIGGRDQVLTLHDSRKGLQKAKPGGVKASEIAPGTDVIVKRADVEASFANLNELINQMRIVPYFAEGRPAGLAVAWVKPDGFFSAMGLKPGDVIQAVNDSPIRSADDIIAVYKDLKVGADITIQVQRESKTHNIRYRFE